MRKPSGIASGRLPSGRTPQRQRGRDRVAGLMAGAAALFVEKGYDATTMTEIAARSGASIGSLYLFFPTKAALARAMLTDVAGDLTTRLDALRARTVGQTASTITDALFDELSRFLTDQPVYAVLLDVPDDEGWKQGIRTQRRSQIAALYNQAVPALPTGQSERLAVIVPQMMRIPMLLGGETLSLRGAVLEELRAMLRHHLT